MIKTEYFFNLLKNYEVSFFTGVPDSLLKSVCAYISDNYESDSHIIAANEGNAIALAAGYNLVTGKIPLVYMQNSGLGNCVNPITSLIDKEVYSIPMLMLIGWRGEPGQKDEPQHIKQGKVTLELLDVLGIKYLVLSTEEQECKIQLEEAMQYAQTNSAPFALVIKSETFSPYILIKKNTLFDTDLTREDAIEFIINHINDRDIVVTTTGKSSRELYELREKLCKSHASDFLTVGSMGHSSSIALSISLMAKDRRVFCIDGDGSVIMHMGALATLGSFAKENFKHIIINNGAYESVGGQPTVGININFCPIAVNCGYKNAYLVQSILELEKQFQSFNEVLGPSLLEIKVNMESRSTLGRPKKSPLENKNEFIDFIR